MAPFSREQVSKMPALARLRRNDSGNIWSSFNTISIGGAGFRTAIALAATFLVIAFVGIGVMLFYYIRYWRRGEAAHLHPTAEHAEKLSMPAAETPTSQEGSIQRAPQPPPLKLVVDTPTESSPLSEDSHSKPIVTDPKARPKARQEKARGLVPEGWRSSQASTNSTNSFDQMPPTPSREMV